MGKEVYIIITKLTLVTFRIQAINYATRFVPIY